MVRKTDTCIDGWMYKQMVKQTDRCIDGWMYKQIVNQIDSKMDIKMDRQRGDDRKIEIQMDGQIYEWIER